MKLLRYHIIKKFDLKVVVNLGEKVFGPKVLNTSTILLFQTPNELKHSEKILVSDFRHYLPEEKINQIKLMKPRNKKEWIKIITNDPGTKRGEEYSYSYDTIEEAMHEWNKGDVYNGVKTAIILK